jgi:hypothetical protein
MVPMYISTTFYLNVVVASIITIKHYAKKKKKKTIQILEYLEYVNVRINILKVRRVSVNLFN